MHWFTYLITCGNKCGSIDTPELRLEREKTSQKLVNKYQEYLECMSTIVDFYISHPVKEIQVGNQIMFLDYAKQFAYAMNDSEKRDSKILEIDSCLNMCREYWKEVKEYTKKFDLDEIELYEFNVRYGRFIRIVGPLYDAMET